MNSIGETLKEIRLAKGITQTYISKEAEITQSNYSKYEKGNIDMGSEAFLRILETMDVQLQEFMYIQNDHQLSKKEAILLNFFKLPFHNLSALSELQNKCIKYLEQSNSVLIQDILILIEALKIIYIENDLAKGRQIVAPIWNRLCKNDELFVYDIYFLNAILYIFSLEEVLNIKHYLLRAYKKYQDFPNTLAIFVNLHINISLLLLENKLYEESLDTLEIVEEICTKKRQYFQLSIIYIRKGICLNNLKKNGDDLIEKGIHWLQMFDEVDALEIMQNEIDLYNKNQNISSSRT
ncbi:helix-turn-helix transcriptional regulator [Solibacillus sp. FSL R7-0682]|uniref:helix-turn-helix domain-containing protein n=1 Tax=Solibacillus sp. FSL R7-0682 TaxID=2921690 RepID=UPI0030F77A0A